jgi:hypothetical protein
MKRPSPYQSILWDMDLKSTPALISAPVVRAAKQQVHAVVSPTYLNKIKKGNTRWCCLFLWRKCSRINMTEVCMNLTQNHANETTFDECGSRNVECGRMESLRSVSLIIKDAVLFDDLTPLISRIKLHCKSFFFDQTGRSLARRRSYETSKLHCYFVNFHNRLQSTDFVVAVLILVLRPC